MTINPYSFDQLPFSELFKTYTKSYSTLQKFYTYNPFQVDSAVKRSQVLVESSTQQQYAKALASYHESLGINQKEQLDKLAQPNSLAIVTGQQLGVYGGPVFTIYKTITAILLAKQSERKLGVPVVPIFWLADEDHDFEEVAWFGIPSNEDLKKIIYEEPVSGKMVSEYIVNETIQSFKAEVKEVLGETDFSAELWELYDSCFSEGISFASAFAKLMDNLFGKHGLVIGGSNTKGIKDLVAGTLSDSIAKYSEIEEVLNNQSNSIAEVFHSQVVLGSSNLFYIDDERKRIKIDRVGDGWEAGSKTWTQAELISDIEHCPERYSPNVLLRPVIQDMLLNTLGYVGGPGETAYYAQMKTLYPIFGLEMPIIFPRISATLLESGIERIMERLPFDLSKYNARIEDLESDYVAMADTHDIELIFDEWKKQLNEVSQYPSHIIKNIDGSLDGTVGKTIAGFESALDGLKGRVYRSVKQQEKVQLQRIRRIKGQLYPGGGLQERMVSFMYFMNKYGITIWGDVLEAFEGEDLDLTHHYILKL